MKKLFSSFGSLVCLLCGWLAFVPRCAEAQESVVVEKYADKPIRGVIIAGAFDLQLQQADGASKQVGAKVEILRELEDKLVFEYTEDGFVRLAFKDDMTKYFTGSKKKPQAWVTVSELTYLNVTGASTVVGTGRCSSSGKLRLMTSGNASVNLLSCSAGEIDIEASGTSDLSDVKLSATGRTTIETSGTAKVRGELRTAEMTLRMTGVSGVVLSGSAAEADWNVGGTSSADLERLETEHVTAEVTGMGQVKACVTGNGTAQVSTMGSFRYTGAGRMTGKGVKRLD
ncbi:DUF2807 domain-containing protein [uncultured Rikenella sp.]|uniref:GIN domain-containing protein n=1 Tax=uncultured Rikenella sp. TaxID=368003 RepID=UPI002604B2A4|nr:DUF2807 domain-containing protein [uncultured Rikenella sp.]